MYYPPEYDARLRVRVGFTAEGRELKMGRVEELAEAIQEIAAKRTVITHAVHVSAAAFDSWLGAAKPSNGRPINQSSLLVISTWIRDLPDLREARSVILKACSRDSEDPSWSGMVSPGIAQSTQSAASGSTRRP